MRTFVNLILTLLLTVTAARGQVDVYLGQKGTTNRIHPTTNYFLAVLGEGPTAVYRLISPAEALASLGELRIPSIAISNNATVNGVLNVNTGLNLGFGAPGSGTALVYLDDLGDISASKAGVGEFGSVSVTGTVSGGGVTATNRIFVGNGNSNSPSISFLGDPTVGIYRAAANQIGFSSSSNLLATFGGGNGWSFGHEMHIDWYSGEPLSSTLDTIIWRSGAGQLGVKRGGSKASPQTTALTLANYYELGGLNEEHAALYWSSHVFTISTLGTGDGESRPMQILANGSILYLNGTHFMPSTPLSLGRADGDHRFTSIVGGIGDFESSSTAGFSVFVTGSGNPAFAVDTVNRRIGVGQAISPGYKLDVVYSDATVYAESSSVPEGIRLYNLDTTAGSTAPIYFQLGSSGGAFASIAGVRESANNAALTFRTQGSGDAVVERMRLTSTGRLGIGTMAPASSFDTTGQVRSASAIFTNSVTILGSTNQVIFGATNLAPASAVAPVKWVSVQVAGDAGVYRLPLYQ